MFELSAYEKLALRYEASPLLQGLLGLTLFWFPGLSDSVTAEIVKSAAAIKRARLLELMDALRDGELELTPALVQSEDFLHCFEATTRATLRTRQSEKRQLFARLLAAATGTDRFRDVEEFEELLSTLDDLSVREIRALVVLDRHSTSGDMTTDDNRNGWRARVREALVAELSIPPTEIPAFLVRLQRSGLFSVPGMGVSEDGSLETTTDKLAGLGELTPRYYRLRELVGGLL